MGKRGSASMIVVLILFCVFLTLTLFYLRPESSDTPPLMGHVKRIHAAEGLGEYLVNWVRHVPVEKRLAYARPGIPGDRVTRFVRRGTYAGLPYVAWIKETKPRDGSLVRSVPIMVRFEANQHTLYYGFDITSPRCFTPPVAWRTGAVPVTAEHVGEFGFPDSVFDQVRGAIVAAHRQHLLNVPLNEHLLGALKERRSLDLKGLEQALTSFNFPDEVSVPALGLAEMIGMIEDGRYAESVIRLENLRGKVSGLSGPWADRYGNILDYYQGIAMARILAGADDLAIDGGKQRFMRLVERERTSPLLTDYHRAVLMLHSALAAVRAGDAAAAETAGEYLANHTIVLAAAGRYFAAGTPLVPPAAAAVAAIPCSDQPVEKSIQPEPADPSTAGAASSGEPVVKAVEAATEKSFFDTPGQKFQPVEPGVAEDLPEPDEAVSETRRKMIEVASGTNTVMADLTLGDLNGDGVVTKRDYILMDKKMHLNASLTAEEHDLLDLNRDGEVDARDQTLLYWRTNPVGDLDGDLEISEYDIKLMEEFIEEYARMEEDEKPEDISRFDIDCDGDVSKYDLDMLKQKYEYMYAMGY